MNILSFINNLKGISSCLILGVMTFALLVSVKGETPLSNIFQSNLTKDDSNHRWHKSDRELIDNLQINRNKFNRLLIMAREDKDLEFISFTQVKLDTYLKKDIKGISKTRVAEYRNLFRELGLAQMRIYRTNENFIPDIIELLPAPYTRVETRQSNNIEHYSFKGYRWERINSETSTESLDKYKNETNLDETKTRRLDKNWSLIYFSGIRDLEICP